MLAVSYMAGEFHATDHACSRAAIVIARSKKEMKRASIGPIRCFGVTKRFYRALLETSMVLENY
jgi:hypothetical protein